MRMRIVPASLALALAASAPDPGSGTLAATQQLETTRVSRLQGGATLGRNRPVVGATVLVSRSDEPSRLFVTTTDSRGRFRVDGLPDGDYRVELRREGLTPVVKENVAVRFPSRAVIEVTLEPLVGDRGTVRPALAETLADPASLRVRGTLSRQEGEPLPDVTLRFARPDGRSDPLSARTAPDGSFAIDDVAAGTWRLEARVVGFLPVWVAMDLVQDTRLDVTMVRQPAGYDPSPLELMPLEQPIPPERFLSPTPPSSIPPEQADPVGLTIGSDGRSGDADPADPGGSAHRAPAPASTRVGK